MTDCTCQNIIDDLKREIKYLDDENDSLEHQFTRMISTFAGYDKIIKQRDDLLLENKILKQRIRYATNTLNGEKKRAT